MKTDTAKLDESGRLVVPASFRRALGVKAGDSLLLRLDDEGMHVSTQAQALARAQAVIRRAVPKDRNLVDELIADRRREAEREGS